ncbi:hypothetical protein BATDEDRAFT_91783 [Batrachochytrium dendrobatidis JAM81]|uniref:Uncharacterized protein n=1 Tax=Batrachochytrium dendrobatidis (strain JAM81 / FGSC 10211) TaxID=684364 RepID=F4PBE8_BATDJ|nr:uncharacterized protein BATDEDRAFT_91783 [Batrachochytrium dendrobatidis JAM81]EGF77432.1 hypothetical protein BATDEDRAFT_91783 [Batrachochytrium dendrobatidis JAM81]|eukprot:XP_006682077.1 hypothetical protein BATDEDRAFT_91783 [Batrachochytrium dendrobatidis JAM81]
MFDETMMFANKLLKWYLGLIESALVPVAMSTFGTVVAGVGALHAPMVAGGCAAIDSISDQQKAKS